MIQTPRPLRPSAAPAVEPEPRLHGGAASGNVIEADYLVLKSSPDKPGRNAVVDVPARIPRAAPDMEALTAARAEPVPLFSRRGGSTFWFFGLALAALSFWVSGGHALLLRGAALPFPAEANTRGDLTVAMLHSEVEAVGGRTVLRIETEARNEGLRAQILPPLSILITTGKGVAMRYSIATASHEIEQGSRQRFTSTLPAPADGVRSVGVAFAQ